MNAKDVFVDKMKQENNKEDNWKKNIPKNMAIMEQ